MKAMRLKGNGTKDFERKGRKGKAAKVAKKCNAET